MRKFLLLLSLKYSCGLGAEIFVQQPVLHNLVAEHNGRLLHKHQLSGNCSESRNSPQHKRATKILHINQRSAQILVDTFVSFLQCQLKLWLLQTQAACSTLTQQFPETFSKILHVLYTTDRVEKSLLSPIVLIETHICFYL